MIKINKINTLYCHMYSLTYPNSRNQVFQSRMLRRTVRRGHQLSAESIATDLYTSCGFQISSRTVHRELHGIGFHGRAAASKTYISKCNAKLQMQWCKARRHRTLEQWRRVPWSDELHFSIWQSDGRVWVQ